jgi:hypothetical protein
MRSRRPALMLLASAVAALVVGCGSDNSGPSNPAPPAGTYALVSIQNPPNTTILTPPVATGSLVLDATTYNVTIAIQGQDPVVDQGTYSISGSNWTQTSTTNQGVQSTGTFTYNQGTGVLSVDVTVVGVRTISVWQKQ